MKRKLFFTLLTVLIYTCTIKTLSAQWTRLSLSQTANIYAVHFYDNNNGFAVGYTGAVLKSTDGGTTWSQVQSGSVGDPEYWAVHFVNASLGIIAGGNGFANFIIKTTDGGVTLDTVLHDIAGDRVWGVQMVDASTGYAVAGKGIIYKTTDGGDTWNNLTSGVTVDLTGLHFTDANTGYASGENGTILKTTNGGTSWTPLTSGTTTDLRDIRFSSGSNGVAVGTDGIILYTSNGGSSWSDKTIDNNISLECVHFSSTNVGFAVGGLGAIYKTGDGGANWVKSVNWSIANDNLWGVHLISDQIALAVGEINFGDGKSTILRTTNGGGTGTGIDNFSSPGIVQLYPNPASSSIALVGLNELPFQLKIRNSSGQVVIESQDLYNRVPVDISAVPSGIYAVEIIQGPSTTMEKLVVN